MDNKRINIDVSYKCNNNCIFCYNLVHNGILPFYRIRDYLNNNSKNHKLAVTISGGEPTLHPDFLQIIAYADKISKSVSILTNGRRFSNREFALNTVKTGRHQYIIPLHAANAEVHDDITRSSGSFRETVAGIKNICRLKNGGYPMTISIKLLFSRVNIKHLPETVRFISKTFSGTQHLFIEPVDMKRTSSHDKNELFITLSESLPYLTEAIHLAVSFGYIISLGHIPPCIFPNPEFYYKFIRTPFNGRLHFCGPMRHRDTWEWDGTDWVIKGPPCRKCEIDQNCNGILLSYSNLSGFSELRPIKMLKRPAWLGR